MATLFNNIKVHTLRILLPRHIGPVSPVFGLVFDDIEVNAASNLLGRQILPVVVHEVPGWINQEDNYRMIHLNQKYISLNQKLY